MDRSIDYVIAVAECKSISQAAEMLYISQPSLSRYLSNLENELGVNLFVRTLNGTELTAAGKIYLEYAKEIKLLKETMNSKLKELKREKKSRIRIGMPLNAASLAAFDVVKEVEKKYPDCGVEIFYRNLLGGLYRENPVKSRNYEAVKSSKKWENVGNSYIIPALLLYRYSYI